MHHHALPASGDLILLFFASLLGSAHCVGMCGPYVAMCTARLAPAGPAASPGVFTRILFNLGRIGAYVAIGAFAGVSGQLALAAGSGARLGGLIAVAAGVMAIAFGLALAGVIPDPAVVLNRAGIDVLIRGGVREAFGAPRVLSPILLGALQGAFPCALVYGAAARAAAAGSPGSGAAVMLVFGLGTVPAIFALSSLSPALLRRVRGFRWAGALIAAVGMLLILRGLAAFGVVAHSMLW